MIKINSHQRRAIEIVKRLRVAWPLAVAQRKNIDPFRVLIGTILSAQCTDIVSGRVTDMLFKKYKGVKSFAKAKQSVLEKQIYPAGCYRSKAKSIISTCKKIVSDYNNKVPDTMKELLTLHGVGRKTANIVLSHAYKKPFGIAVDTHVRRVSQRLGLSGNANPDKIEQDLLRLIPRKYWLDFNMLLVTHGRRVCKAQNPSCCECLIKTLCKANRCGK